MAGGLFLCCGLCLLGMSAAARTDASPVMITVSTRYTGASAEVLYDSVGAVLEDQINGLDDVLYCKSTCNNTGLYTCHVAFRPGTFFRPGTSSDIALMNVQSAVNCAEPKLPTEVRRNGIVVRKSPNPKTSEKVQCVGFYLCALAGQSPQELLKTADAMVASLRTNRLVKAAVHGLSPVTQQLELRLDRRKAEMLGLTPKVIFQTLQNKLASYYVNDFNIKGGVYEVKLQNDPDRRASVKDIIDIRIPTSKGESVPISSLGSIEYVAGMCETMHYNKMLAAWVEVTPAEGVSTSEVMDLIRRADIPKDYVVEWGVRHRVKKGLGWW